IAIVLAMRTVGEAYTGLPQLRVQRLRHAEALELFRRFVPGPIDPRVRDQILAEAGGNPLALQELSRSPGSAMTGAGYDVADTAPLESRIEKSLLAQLAPLPASARQLLLLA